MTTPPPSKPRFSRSQRRLLIALAGVLLTCLCIFGIVVLPGTEPEPAPGPSPVSTETAPPVEDTATIESATATIATARTARPTATRRATPTQVPTRTPLATPTQPPAATLPPQPTQPPATQPPATEPPVATATLPPPPSDTPPPAPVCECTGDLYNCSDFATHAGAQQCFDYCYPIAGDIHELDQDGDLIACESLPALFVGQRLRQCVG